MQTFKLWLENIVPLRWIKDRSGDTDADFFIAPNSLGITGTIYHRVGPKGGMNAKDWIAYYKVAGVQYESYHHKATDLKNYVLAHINQLLNQQT